MKFVINKDKLTIVDKDKPNSGSIQYYEIDVEYDNSWNDLTIKGIIVANKEDIGRQVSLINNKVFIDNDLEGTYNIGFVGYTIEYNLTEDTTIDRNKTYYTRSGTEGSYVYTKVENPTQQNINTYYEATKIYQISTNLKGINFNRGAGQIETEEGKIPKPTEWEVYIAQIQDMVDDLQSQIPTKYSDLTNDNNTVQDASYVHTDNNFTNTYKSNVDSNTTARHTHSNKTVLDNISSTDISNWDNKSDFSGDYNDLTNKPTIPDEVTETTVSNWGFTKNTGTYSKPSGGIPKTDLSSSVQTSLEKADSAIQDISSKQDLLVSGTNIKTINNNSILGSGNITIEGGGTATDVQINGTSIVSNNTANILTNTAYNSSTNKIATMSDIPSISGKLDTSKVKNAYSTTSGDVYDVTYINTTVGNIETLLSAI